MIAALGAVAFRAIASALLCWVVVLASLGALIDWSHPHLHGYAAMPRTKRLACVVTMLAGLWLLQAVLTP